VAGIVKLDDAGLALSRMGSRMLQAVGRGLLVATPWLMKTLAIAGTAAMFLVGGGILTHGVPALHHLLDWLLHGFSGATATLGTLLFDLLAGFVAGLVVLAAVTIVQRFRSRPAT
jgi:predicted DNA repair protein MutK